MSQPDAAFRSFDPMTSPGAHPDLFENTPSDPKNVSEAVQGLILHQHWAEAYGQTLTPARIEETNLRSIEDMLHTLLEHEKAPLTRRRDPARRLVGNCRHFSLMAVAMLRAQEKPARARCGFATYFEPGKFVDHWVVEYWHERRNRWEMFDAQLDGLQLGVIKPDFDPLHVPADRFITGGQAWKDCRAGRTDPDLYGIADLHGLWFVAGDLVRDVCALANHVMLPWDVWGMMDRFHQNGAAIPDEDAAFLDRLADLTAEPDRNIHEIHHLVETDPRLKIPGQVFNAVANRVDTL